MKARHVKAPARFVASFGRSAATRAASLRAKGSGAPSPRRPKLLLLAACAALLTALVLGVSLASATAPTVTIAPAENVEYTTARLKGEVDSSEQSTSWRFQYISEEAFQANLDAEPPLPGFEGATDGPAGTLESGSDSISRKLTGLSPATTYHLRLLAENGEGTAEAIAGETFTTKGPVLAPTIGTPKATEVLYTTAQATGTVKAGGADPAFNSPCHFDYVTDLHFNTEGGFEGASQAGCDVEPGGAGTTDVKATLTELAPATTYHLRLVASNAGGESFSPEPEPTFTTLPVAKPALTTPVITAITATSAHFAAEVNPDAPEAEPASPAVEEAFRTHWSFSCEPVECPGMESGDQPADNAFHPIATDAGGPEGLQPNTTYTVIAHAANLGGEETKAAAATFTTPAVGPVVATGTNTPDGHGGSIVRGYVNPRNSAITDCHFEFGLTTSYGQEAPCSPTHPATGEVQAIRVEAAAGQFKLSFGAQTTADIAFDAPPSTVQAALRSLSSIGSPNVLVSGGPGDGEGRFPYLVTFTNSLAGKDVEQIAVENGTIPLSGGEFEGGASTSTKSAANLSSPVEVSFDAQGLTAGAIYHFRVLATNGSGTTPSDDGVFVVPAEEDNSACPNQARREEEHSTLLPDCRAYEMVSPSDKNGADVVGDPGRTRPAADGSAVNFASLAGFGDVIGTGVSIDYLSIRDGLGGRGWSTHAITPKQEAQTYFAGTRGAEPQYSAFTPDLTRGVFRAWSPLSEAPNVSRVENFYLRSDARTPGAGSYQLLTDAPAPVGSDTVPLLNANLPVFAGASTDLGHVLFESVFALTSAPFPQTPFCNFAGFGCSSRLYESDHGTVYLAGLIPPAGQEECGPSPLPSCEPAATSEAGQGAANSLHTPHTISSDGSRIFFTDNSAAPSCGLFSPCSGDLYMRLNHTTTVKLNASERATADPRGPAPATYWDAAADGSRVFFTTGEALTEDASLGGDRNVYMYDTTKPASDPHNLTLLNVDHEPADISNDAQGVIGASADGHYVYFVTTGQLVAGKPQLGEHAGIYLWHDGTIDYVGELAHFGEDQLYDLNSNWNLTPSRARVTPDGKYLIFSATSGEGLTGYDHGRCAANGDNPCAEMYLYSAPTHTLACVSCDPTGAPATADGLITTRTNGGASVGTAYPNHALSDDGRYVFFNTAAALVSEDSNGQTDVYEYDSTTGALHLLSSGNDPSPSYFMAASDSGNDAFILTRQQLVGWDTDGNFDLYDVRVGGGFPEPAPVPAVCGGENCQPSAAPQPSAKTPGTLNANGPGNPPPPRCKKGFLRRDGHCVKRHHKKPKHHKRAGHNGGGRK